MDIKGAYDGIKHQVIEEHLKTWRKWGYFGDKNFEQLTFLFNQYKLGLIEPKETKLDNICLVNVGFP